MPFSWQLDETGDLVMSAGRFDSVEGEDLTMQKVRQTLRTNLGEWMFNEEKGFPRFDILGGGFNNDRIMDAVTEALTQIDEVASVDDVYNEFDPENRTLYVTFTFTRTDDDESVTDTMDWGMV